MGLPEAQLRYFANISRLDDRVGEALEYLDEEDLRSRTRVVFVADNGWDSLLGEEGHPRDRGKLSPYELGFRTPLIFSWPGHISGGRRSDELVSIVDIVETVLELTDARPLPGADRISLIPLLTGNADPSDPDGGDATGREQVIGGTSLLLEERSQGGLYGGRANRDERTWFARTAAWRYLWYPERGAEELYRIDRDPMETTDVLEQHPDQAAMLRSSIEEWRTRLRDGQRTAEGSR
jgi:uncharacterized sulfatase